LFWLPTVPAALVFALFWLVGAAEWARIAGLTQAGRIVYCVLYAGFVALVIAVGIEPRIATGLLSLAAVCWLLTFVVVLRYPQPLARAPILAMGVIVLTAAWLSVWLLHGAGERGPALILSGLFIVWAADIGAYFVGRGLGRTPLAPRVSPKKTWEGVAGGIALALLTGALAAP
jgi:phosphatidate cytidylyltransferase